MNEQLYAAARDAYAVLGVNTETALKNLEAVKISLHCWQGDDVGGFEKPDAQLSGGGIQATGNYPGKARTLAQLRQDLDQALALIPGKHRLNLHALYADLEGKKIERSEYGPAQFQSWIDWAKERGLGLDYNPSYFSHPLAEDGLTLSHPDKAVRQYWIEHGINSRKIGAEMGRQLSNTAVTNFWIPDGSKDTPVDRKGPRERLTESLDAIFATEIDRKLNLDALEGKLFGIGSESYVVGSHEYYLGYAIKHQKLLCLDAGHYHPTENMADKISAVLQFVPEILLHVSRGVRWDSDHVVILDDATKGIMEELVRGGYLARTHIGLDFFDASINRLAAWIVGTRSALKGLLLAFLEPAAKLRALEAEGDFTSRLALFEETKTLPFGPVWDEFCRRQNVPVGTDWIVEMKNYERKVLAGRS